MEMCDICYHANTSTTICRICQWPSSYSSTCETITETGLNQNLFNISCICGHPLTKYNESKHIYNTGSAVMCDICDKKIPPNEAAWHCGTGKNSNHPYGYDACDGCAMRDIGGDYIQINSDILGIQMGSKCWIYMPDSEKNYEQDWQQGIVKCIYADKKSKQKYVIIHVGIYDYLINAWSEYLILEQKKQISEHINFDIFKQQQRGCKRIIKDCQCLQRVIYALKYYETLDAENTATDRDKLVKFASDVYKGLLNDYIHIIDYHNDSIQLEEISHILYEIYEFNTCDIDKCGKKLRYRKDRSNEEMNVDPSLDPQYVFYRELFNQIHCYLYHLFDLGLRIRQKSCQSIATFNQFGIDKFNIIANAVRGI